MRATTIRRRQHGAYTDLEFDQASTPDTAPARRFISTAPYLEGFHFGSSRNSTRPKSRDADAPREFLATRVSPRSSCPFSFLYHAPRAKRCARRRGRREAGTEDEPECIGSNELRKNDETRDSDNSTNTVHAATDFVRGKSRRLPGPAPSPLSQNEIVSTRRVEFAIALLVEKSCCAHSTFQVFEPRVPGRPILSTRELDALNPTSRENYLKTMGSAVNGRHDAAVSPSGRRYSRLETMVYGRRACSALATDFPTGTARHAGHGSLRELGAPRRSGLTPQVHRPSKGDYNGARC